MSDEKLTRLAIVNTSSKVGCKPKKCRLECKRYCPVVRTGKLCIEVTPTSKIAKISETLCIGCGICVKKCPFKAIKIINVPKSLEKETTHRYGPNQFKLHRLPTPRPGQVLGLVGTNGIGKSTALKVLAGKLKPNLGRFDDPPDWEEILKYFRGSELQNYFTKILEDDLKAVIKPQYVDHIPRAVKGDVQRVIKAKDEKPERTTEILKTLELVKVMDRKLADLSGGELQRFAIAVVCIQKADIYMFDEPSSYLDVQQRLNAARVIRDVLNESVAKEGYVIVVEHDLSILDYLSDFVCVLYGTPGAYGVVILPFGVREGINVFLAGHIPTENLRFRPFALSFKVSDALERDFRKNAHYKYPNMKKTLGSFQLNIESGSFTNSEIVVLLGQNGTGKTTFIKMLAGILKPDTADGDIPKLHISYKPQKISPKFPGSVRALLMKRLGNRWRHPQFQTDVVKPMAIEGLLDQDVKSLSGGELQRLALILCLGTPADIYLIDEPSAYLDSEQRLLTAKVIKRFILHAKKSGFVVEHDFIMATYLADKVVVYKGEPSINCTAQKPQTLVSGMNAFLKILDISFRRDPNNFRPRINKYDSVKDKEQKLAGNYFFMENF